MTSWLRKKRHSIPLALLVAGVLVAVAAVVSPWPAALLIRAMFVQNAAETVTTMQPFEPTSGLDATLDVQYGADSGPAVAAGADTTFDAYSPSNSTAPLPTLIWIHGGAWISGSKENVDPYVKIIAAEGARGCRLHRPVVLRDVLE